MLVCRGWIIDLEVVYVRGTGRRGDPLGAPGVVMRDIATGRQVLLDVEPAVACSIANALHNLGQHIPSAAHLLADLLRTDNAHVPKRVLLTDSEQRVSSWQPNSVDAYLAHLECRSSEGGEIRLQCSPGDAVELALRLRLPINAPDDLSIQFDDEAERAMPVEVSDEVVAWLRRHAIPLVSYEHGNDFTDLEPVKQIVGDARIVGLGEATHGASEFYLMKHRLFEFLVEKMGFNTLAIEAPFPESLAVNDYIKGGRGDLRAVVAGLLTPEMETQEFFALIEWMRRYNTDHTERTVDFFGVDMQFFSIGAVRRLVSYLDRVDPGFMPSIGVGSESDSLPPEAQKAIHNRLVAGEAAYVGRSSRTAWANARLLANVAIQAEQEKSESDYTSMWRDLCLADNVTSVLNLRGPGAKIVLWAHNGHVRRREDEAGGWMGWHLARRYGPSYVNIGLVFGEGCFRAESQGVMRDFAVGPAPVGTLEAALGQVDHDLFLIDLSQIEIDEPMGRWLGSKPPMKQLGYNLAEPTQTRDYVVDDPRETYDALLYVRRTTAVLGMPTIARPTESVSN